MDALVVTKSNKLNGKIKIKGAKNSVLPILAACVLTSDDVVIGNCPRLNDIDDMLGIIRSIGGIANRDGDKIEVCCKDINPYGIDYELMKKIRSSVFILGPLLARCGEARAALPGGCEIGQRPIDLHLCGLKSLGIDICEDKMSRRIGCKGYPKGGVIRLRYPSVGATENLIMAAALTEGRTTICGGAKEPEIVDLANFINAMGARVYGAGGDVIVVDGKSRLHGARHMPIPDRIVAGTYMAAASVCGGDIFLEGAVGDHMDATLYKLRMLGAHIIEQTGGIRLISVSRPVAIRNTVTMPYPGFPTDMQPILTAVLAGAVGTSVIAETLFESRFRYIAELKKMGADICEEEDNSIKITGTRLHGADVRAMDLRGGAALTVAGLGADGITYISGAEHIDRGYESIERDLAALGANIERIKDIV